MNDENKKVVKVIPKPKATINIKPVPIPVKPNSTQTPKVIPTPNKVIKPTPLKQEAPIIDKVIKPTPVVTPKPVVEKPKIEEKKEEIKTEIKEEVKAIEKPEVKEEVKKMAKPDPRFAPKNAFAPPNLNQDKDKIFESESNNYQNTLNKEEDNTTSQSEGDQLYQAFIGKNYHKIMTRTINFSGLFFGVFYMFYRKMIFYGVLILLIQLIVSFFIPTYIASMPYLSLIPNLLIFLLFNKLYLSYAGKKIDKIKSNYLHLQIDDLKVECANEGGTSIGNIFAGFFTTIIISFLIGLLLSLLGLGLSFKKIINYIKNPSNGFIDVEDDDELPKGKDYDGLIIYDTSKKVTEIFNITIPESLTKTDITNESDFEYQYKDNDGKVQCKVKFSALKMYNDDEKLIKQMREYLKTTDVSSVNKDKINNIEWFWFTHEDDFDKTYEFATLYEKRVFLLEYEIDKNAPKECETYRNSLLNGTSIR